MGDKFKFQSVEEAENLIGERVAIFKASEKIDEGRILSVDQGEDGNTYLTLKDRVFPYHLYDVEFALVEETDKEKILRLRSELKHAEFIFRSKAPKECKFSVTESGAMRISRGDVCITISPPYLTFDGVKGQCLDLEMVLVLVDEYRKNL